MRKLLILLMALPVFCMAQEKGIHFEHGLTWAEVQAKAKAENKYIFMDCFTTWCGPCRYMSTTVFPQEEVGTYFNDKFISVKVQLDTTAKDNEDVKKWYADGHNIMQQYKVRAFPTFLFFAPDGSIVHRMVGGGEAKEFVERASAAVDPNKQYYTLIKKYEAGEKSPEFLRNTALAANDAYDPDNAKSISDAYLATQKDLYTKDNIEFLDKFTNSTKDKGFAIFLKEPKKVDAVLGAGKASAKVQNILLREEVYPVISAKGRLVDNPDWAALETTLNKKYPAQAAEVMALSKVFFYQNKKDWKNFQAAIVPYMNKYGNAVNSDNLNNYAWAVFENCSDVTCLQMALDWSKRSFEKDNTPGFIDTYANILYKLGKKDDAIAWETKALNAVPDAEKKNYQETIDKMKKGEKTWVD